VGGRNAVAVRRLLEDEAEDGDALPTDRAIRRWAHQQAWAVRADGELRETKDQTLYELGVKGRALVLGSFDVLLKAQTGGYAGREMEGALAVKASEVALRAVERGIMPKIAEPPEEKTSVEELPRESREALAKSSMIQRERSG
jgi:hypothetical protein